MHEPLPGMLSTTGEHEAGHLALTTLEQLLYLIIADPVMLHVVEYWDQHVQMGE